MDEQGVDVSFCIGDLVGYGAEPVAVLEWIRERAEVIVAGNHDHAMSGILPLSHFNEFARQAAEWTVDQLYDEHIQMLRRLPVKKTKDEVTLVHATLSSPAEFNYIMNESHAKKNFEALDTKIGFVGHSHVPMNFLEREKIRFSAAEKVNVEDDLRLIVNVGSVGQPRDSDPRASYAIYDDDEDMIYIRRVEYDIESAADKIREAGLPVMLAERLFEGK
jgi:diadenosine tetraphosphatase ApaH/serine/threonine PP2A family protein phosphatase